MPADEWSGVRGLEAMMEITCFVTISVVQLRPSGGCRQWIAGERVGRGRVGGGREEDKL